MRAIDKVGAKDSCDSDIALYADAKSKAHKKTTDRCWSKGLSERDKACSPPGYWHGTRADPMHACPQRTPVGGPLDTFRTGDSTKRTGRSTRRKNWISVSTPDGADAVLVWLAVRCTKAHFVLCVDRL